MVLADGTGLRVSFSAQGEILEIRNETCGWQFPGQVFGWSLRTEWNDATPGMLVPDTPRAVSRPTPLCLLVTFDRARREDGSCVPVEIVLAWTLEAGRLQGRIVHAALPEGVQAAALSFPEVEVDYGQAVQWVVPDDLGRVFRNPGAAQAQADGYPFRCRFYHAHREWLLWGEMLAPGQVRCDEVEVTCISRTIFTRPESIVPFAVHCPAVLHSAWQSPQGSKGMVLVNFTRDPRTVAIERSDGLVPEAGDGRLDLPPRSLRFVPLRDGG